MDNVFGRAVCWCSVNSFTVESLSGKWVHMENPQNYVNGKSFLFKLFGLYLLLLQSPPSFHQWVFTTWHVFLTFNPSLFFFEVSTWSRCPQNTFSSFFLYCVLVEFPWRAGQRVWKLFYCFPKSPLVNTTYDNIHTHKRSDNLLGLHFLSFLLGAGVCWRAGESQGVSMRSVSTQFRASSRTPHRRLVSLPITILCILLFYKHWRMYKHSCNSFYVVENLALVELPSAVISAHPNFSLCLFQG